MADAGPAQPISFFNPTFNFRSLRGNAVMRWEYKSGSTLFFVWQQSRSGSEPFGDFNFSRPGVQWADYASDKAR